MKRDEIILNGEVITTSFGKDGSNSCVLVNCKNRDVFQLSSRNYTDYIMSILSRLKVVDPDKDLTFTVGRDGYYQVQAAFTSAHTYWSISEIL